MWQAIKNYYHLARALTAAIFFNFPSKKLTVIGVTGTDGKTTTVNMIYHILKSAGKKVSMISSVNAQIGQKSYDTGFHVTTPNPWDIQRFLREAQRAASLYSERKNSRGEANRKRGRENHGRKDVGIYFVLEATSHGLDQNRLRFIDFNVALVTNITHEHLDYHKTWENYAQAKARLFQKAKYSILNLDDRKSYVFLKSRAQGKIISYSLKGPADVTLKKFPIKLKVPAEFNLANALAAAAACSSLGVAKKTILKTLFAFPGVVGRLEQVYMGQDFKVIVDFAHTPNGLENALKALGSQLTLRKSERDLHSSRLIAIFGSAGLRDRAKRQLMGKIAAQFADLSVLTAEDPRTENVNDIIDEIAKGLTSKGKKEGRDFFKVPDRQKAIEFAIINLAQKGDIVATFGKGHEKSMTYGKSDFPWDEFEVVRQAIAKRLKNER